MIVHDLAQPAPAGNDDGPQAIAAALHDRTGAAVAHRDAGGPQGLFDLGGGQESPPLGESRAAGRADLDQAAEIDGPQVGQPAVEPLDEPVEGMVVRSDGGEQHQARPSGEAASRGGGHNTAPTTWPRG